MVHGTAAQFTRAAHPCRSPARRERGDLGRAHGQRSVWLFDQVEVGDLVALEVDDGEAAVVVAVEGAGVDEDERRARPAREGADHPLVGVAAGGQREGRIGEQLGEREVGLEVVALVVRAQADHVVGADAVAEQEVAARGREAAGGRQRGEVGEGRGGEVDGLVGVPEAAQLVAEEPAIVVAAHDLDAVGGQEGAAAVEVARAVGEVADGEHGVEGLSLEPCEDEGEAAILGVEIAEQGEATEHGERDEYATRARGGGARPPAVRAGSAAICDSERMHRAIAGALWAAALSVSLVVAPAPAAAFCGFFVGSAGQPLRSPAASVVLMREGTRTVVTMQSAYEGPPEDFALVVPVPQVLRRGQVKTLPPEVMARVDTLSAPRLVEYWEADPCRNADKYVVDGQNATSPAFGSVAHDVLDPGRVRVQARFAAGEYDIVILGARDSTRLVEWLRAHEYALPDGAEAALRPYVQAGMKFFVARVAIDRVKRDAQGRVMLSPLRFHYESERFELPVRLGLLNADGPQDLIVHVLARSRYQAANRDNVAMPTNLQVTAATREVFGSVYAALVDHVLAARPGAVLTEYAWGAESCDPCPGPTLDRQTIVDLGGDVLWFGKTPTDPIGLPPQELDVAGEEPFQGTDPVVHGKYKHKRDEPARVWGNFEGPNGLTLTRLHLRLQPGAPGEDLVLAAAPTLRGGGGSAQFEAATRVSERAARGLDRFQARYIIRRPWAGPLACSRPERGAWHGSPPAGWSKVEVASGSAVAPRDVALTEYLVDGLPGVEGAPLAASPAPPEPPATPGCGRCDAAGGPGIAAIVAVGLLGRRRRKCSKGHVLRDMSEQTDARIGPLTAG